MPTVSVTKRVLRQFLRSGVISPFLWSAAGTMFTQVWEVPSQVWEVMTDPSVVASLPAMRLVHSRPEYSSSWAASVNAARMDRERSSAFFILTVKELRIRMCWCSSRGP